MKKYESLKWNEWGSPLSQCWLSIIFNWSPFFYGYTMKLWPFFVMDKINLKFFWWIQRKIHVYKFGVLVVDSTIAILDSRTTEQQKKPKTVADNKTNCRHLFYVRVCVCVCLMVESIQKKNCHLYVRVIGISKRGQLHE